MLVDKLLKLVAGFAEQMLLAFVAVEIIAGEKRALCLLVNLRAFFALLELHVDALTCEDMLHVGEVSSIEPN